METKNIFEKLLSVQTMLKAPKSQYNAFGKYNYRNCEDILEAVKPLCKEVNATVYLTDEIVQIGERYYVKATAYFVNADLLDQYITVTAYAREEETKKGMDGSQVTGASSSYARKYALNGLFDIDDTKDSDTTNTHGKEETPKQDKPTPKQKTPRELLIAKLKAKGIDPTAYATEKGINKETPPETYTKLLKELEEQGAYNVTT